MCCVLLLGERSVPILFIGSRWQEVCTRVTWLCLEPEFSQKIIKDSTLTETLVTSLGLMTRKNLFITPSEMIPSRRAGSESCLAKKWWRALFNSPEWHIISVRVYLLSSTMEIVNSAKNLWETCPSACRQSQRNEVGWTKLHFFYYILLPFSIS